MSRCARCGASPADFFGSTGDTLCKGCFSNEQIRAADDRARASLEQDLPEGVKYSTEPASPTKIIGAGALLLFIGVGLGGAFFFGAGEIRLWPILVAGAGVVSLSRGLMLLRAR